jgi:hypothetical protein
MSDSSKESLSALAGSLTGLTIIAVGLRFWARRRHKSPMLADDWLAAIALVSNPQHDLGTNSTHEVSLLTEDDDDFSFPLLEHQLLCSSVSRVPIYKNDSHW